MKNYLMVALCIMMFSLVGCGGNAVLRAEVARLEQVSHQQDQQIVELKSQLAVSNAKQASGNLVEAGEQAFEAVKNGTPAVINTVQGAWSWTSSQISDAYKSLTNAAHKCYDDKVKLDTFEDYRILAMKCWEENTK